MKTLGLWLKILLCVAVPTQAAASGRWSAGFNAGGTFSAVEASGGTTLAIYCNAWVKGHPAGLLIVLPTPATEAEDKTYNISFSFKEGEIHFAMLLTQGRALQFSAKGEEKFSALEKLVALIKANDGFLARSDELGWHDDFPTENAGPAIGRLLECDNRIPD